jgi:hypothetical protein
MLAIGACALGPVLGGAAVQRYGIHDAIEILLFLVVLLVFLSLETPEVAHAVDEIRRSILRSPPFGRVVFLSTNKADVNLPSGAPVSTRFCRKQNNDGKIEFFLAKLAHFVSVKTGRPFSTNHKEALNWANVDELWSALVRAMPGVSRCEACREGSGGFRKEWNALTRQA